MGQRTEQTEAELNGLTLAFTYYLAGLEKKNLRIRKSRAETSALWPSACLKGAAKGYGNHSTVYEATTDFIYLFTLRWKKAGR